MKSLSNFQYLTFITNTSSYAMRYDQKRRTHHISRGQERVYQITNLSPRKKRKEINEVTQQFPISYFYYKYIFICHEI